ncbi:MAG: hypothetical protein CL583_01340 [Alteromonadaceae bacterium]|nr:hypothetical protein [Alteromonadaceae bacterium]|tara:strand:+ start:4963 stop:6093 length:1131 start_codon:yes stop_codon:yes gene_type:complete
MTQIKAPKGLRRVAGFAVLTSFTALAHAGPQNGTIAFGQGSIAQAGVDTNISQTSDRMAIDWASFNIGAGESVNFTQPDAGAIALNRDFSGNVSQIFGSLNANGQVFLLNSAGVLIGSTGAINTGGLLISDRDLNLDDFAEGSFLLDSTGETSQGIRNEGTVSVGAGGAHFITRQVFNSGALSTSDGGDISFTFTDGATVSVEGADSRVSVEAGSPMDELSGNDLLTNTAAGSIVTVGGNIRLTANYYSELSPVPVNNEGLVNAIAVSGEGGRIFLVDNPVIRVAEPTPAPVEPSVPGMSDEEFRDQIVSEQDSSPGGEGSSSSEFAGTGLDTPVTLDDLVAACDPLQDGAARNCEREEAVKRYLGRLLVNGRLPQ